MAPPENSIASGAGGYYYAYLYGYGYDTGNAVFCLGEDRATFQPYRYNINDTITVEQTFTVSAAHKLILFSFHMRTPPMPTPRDIIVAGPVDIVRSTGLISSGDGCSGVRLPNTALASSLFTADDRELWLQISGATNPTNDGTHRISGIPWNQGNISGGEAAILENSNTLGLAFPNTATMVDQLADPAVTMSVLGLRWVSRAYADWGAGMTERVSLEEPTGHTWYRTDLALHVSKYTGSLTVRFESKLELIT